MDEPVKDHEVLLVYIGQKKENKLVSTLFFVFVLIDINYPVKYTSVLANKA